MKKIVGGARKLACGRNLDGLFVGELNETEAVKCQTCSKACNPVLGVLWYISIARDLRSFVLVDMPYRNSLHYKYWLFVRDRIQIAF